MSNSLIKYSTKDESTKVPKTASRHNYSVRSQKEVLSVPKTPNNIFSQLKHRTRLSVPTEIGNFVNDKNLVNKKRN